MIHTARTTLPASDVLEKAEEFFALRVPHNAAFPESRGPDYLVLRGQGGEEIAIRAAEDQGITAVRASTLLFDQAVSRFLSSLPRAGEVA